MAYAESVSIPQSEFCPLGREQVVEIGADITGFNSSVGILSVGTYPGPRTSPKGCEFQFLSRNSVRWDSSLADLAG